MARRGLMGEVIEQFCRRRIAHRLRNTQHGVLGIAASKSSRATAGRDRRPGRRREYHRQHHHRDDRRQRAQPGRFAYSGSRVSRSTLANGRKRLRAAVIDGNAASATTIAQACQSDGATGHHFMSTNGSTPARGTDVSHLDSRLSVELRVIEPGDQRRGRRKTRIGQGVDL